MNDIPNSQQQAGYSNLAQSAIALILHQPEIARQVKAGGLTELSGDNVALLAELIDLVQRRPESNTGMLLGHWYGTPEGELLNQLAGQERLIPTAGIERQFNDIIYNDELNSPLNQNFLFLHTKIRFFKSSSFSFNLRHTLS